MQELAWLAEPIRIWLEGGTWAEISSAPGARMLMLLGAVLIPSTIIALGMGTSEWRETPLARWFGAGPADPFEDKMWTWRARDIDNDGTPDI